MLLFLVAYNRQQFKMQVLRNVRLMDAICLCFLTSWMQPQ